MPPVAFLGSVSTGHGCWPPTVTVVGHPQVLVSLFPIHLLGMPWLPHCCVFPMKDKCFCHFGVAAGPMNVLVNLSPVQAMGSIIKCCGPASPHIDFIALGNPTVIVGGFGDGGVSGGTGGNLTSA